MLRYYYKTVKEETFVEIAVSKEGCWIHADEATPEDLAIISQISGIELADLQDCLDRFEMPRIERVHQHVLIFTRHPQESEAGLFTAPLTCILASHWFISISPYKNQLLPVFISEKHRFSTAQKSKLLIHLLLKITQQFTSQIRKVHTIVLTQEKEQASVDSEDIAILTKNEEILNQYAAGLSPLKGVLQEITSGKYTSLYEKDQNLLEDLVNAVKQSEDLCEIMAKTIRGLRNSYQILFTNNLHKTIKLLTGLTIICSIPTMVASLYGMNVSLPFAQTPYAFFLLLSVIFGISAAALYLFHRKK